jgi:hypothetical protein
MKTLRIASRVALFVSAVVLVGQVSAVRASGDEGNPQGKVDVTFTKWVLTLGPNPGFFEGFTGGDVEGDFVGETFVNVARTNPAIPSLSNLEVIYGVQAANPDHSFYALIRGGAALGRAQLDGRILAGWRIGDEVHVEWVRFPSPGVNCPSPPEFAGPFCFVGTITIEPGNGE